MPSLLARLDAFGMHPEGHPEDRCELDEIAVADHPCWRHRVNAAVTILFRRWWP